jgi:hypothetical protein
VASVQVKPSGVPLIPVWTLAVCAGERGPSIGTNNFELRSGTGSPLITCSTVIMVMLAPIPSPMASAISAVSSGERFRLRRARSM